MISVETSLRIVLQVIFSPQATTTTTTTTTTTSTTTTGTAPTMPEVCIDVTGQSVFLMAI